ncbi:hypothetical protein DFH07DRAFT_952458 [Mycena maculata]|uniref:Uncharacterized protein n=1 Tax=Mycena maculata TaxID=230809 RepID=A0AAD7NT85_9AGAR|nr:hypothetical protein DFH07DRAFT_952458 [Mycena maculata]
MPVTLPDDVAASLLAALTNTDANSLPPLFGDFRNLLLSANPTTTPEPSNAPQRPRALLMAERVDTFPPPLTSTPMHQLAPPREDLLPCSTTTSPTLHGSPMDTEQQQQCLPSPPGRLLPLRFNFLLIVNAPQLSLTKRTQTRRSSPLWYCRLERAALRTGGGPRSGLTITIPPLGAAGACPPRPRAAAGGNGGGAGGGAGPVPVVNRDCPRKGDKARVGTAGDISMMPCNQPDCEDCHNQDDYNEGNSQTRSKNNSQTGSRKTARGAREDGAWTVDVDGAPITIRAGDLLSQFLSVFGLAQGQALDKILDSGTACTDAIARPTSYNIPTIVVHVKAQMGTLQMSELHYMLILVQLALSIDCLQRDRSAKGLPKMIQDDLTDTYSAGTKR